MPLANEVYSDEGKVQPRKKWNEEKYNPFNKPSSSSYFCVLCAFQLLLLYRLNKLLLLFGRPLTVQ